MDARPELGRPYLHCLECVVSPEADAEEGFSQAISILNHIGITGLTYKPDASTLSIGGQLMLDAVLCISKANAVNALKVLMEFIKIRHSLLAVVPVNVQVEESTYLITVRTPHVFVTIAVNAVRHLLPALRNYEGYESVLTETFELVEDYIVPSCPFVGHYIKTLYMILKHDNVESHTTNIKLMHVLGACATFANTGTADYASKLIELLVMKWSQGQKLLWLATLTSTADWDHHHCQIIIHLLKFWPAGVDFPYGPTVLKSLSTSMAAKNIGKVSFRLLNIIFPYVNLQTWITEFVLNLIEKAPRDLESKRAFMKSTLLECVYMGVKHYRIALFDYVKVHAENLYFVTFVMYSSVKEGLISINDHNKNIINVLLKTNDELVQQYVLKTICHIKKRNYEISKWHFNCMEFYMENVAFSKSIELCEDWKFFLSHMCVRGVDIIKHSSIPVHLNIFEDFLERSFEFCMKNLESRDFDQIAIGLKWFNFIYMIFTGSSSSLCTKYALNENDKYDKGCSPFLQYLVQSQKWHFNNPIVEKTLFSEFIQCDKFYTDTSNLLENYLNMSLTSDQLHKFHLLGMYLLMYTYDYESVKKGSKIICLTSLTLATKVEDLERCDAVINQIYTLWCKQTKNVKVEYEKGSLAVFGLTSCLGDLIKNNQLDLKTKSDEFLHDMCKACADAIKLIVHTYPYYETAVKDAVQIKNVEYAILSLLDLMKYILDAKPVQNLTRISFDAAHCVLVAACGRRPVSSAATTMRDLSDKILRVVQPQYIDSQAVIIKYLENVLYSIHTAPEKQTSKMRRNPEYRLIIHSIVAADRRPNHPFLVRSMEFLLDVLSNSSSTNSSKAAAFHTLEVLMADNTIRNATFPFVSSVTIHCINEFASNDWRIKNATCQTATAVVTRLLGQKCISTNRRYNSLDEVFVLYPHLAAFFYSKLQNSVLEISHDSVIAILAFFSESHCKSDIFLTDDMNFIMDCFTKIFMNLMCNDISAIGLFAANAYAAMYPHKLVPFIICDIVEWLNLNFSRISKNIFYSFMTLLQTLYEKFNLTPNVFYYNPGLCIIQSAFKRLFLFLERFNDKYEFSLFSLLSIKSTRISISENTVFTQIQNDTYQSRLWLHNNIPWILNHIEIEKFPNFLEKCLSCSLSLSLEVHCLNGIITRFDELVQHSLAERILTVLINKFLKSTDACQYLICSYSHIVLLFCDVCNFTLTEDLIIRLRSSYSNIDTHSIFILSVYAVLLSKFSTYSDEDQVFIKNTLITAYNNAALIDDFEIQSQVASTLKYLYKCAEIPDRHHVLKIAFMLLLTKETGTDICKFVAFVFNVEFSSTYVSLVLLISVPNLVYQLGTTVQAATFLVDLAIFISTLPDLFENCGAFYLKQNSDICSHKYAVRKMLIEEVKIAFSLLSREDCNVILRSTGLVGF